MSRVAGGAPVYDKSYEVSVLYNAVAEPVRMILAMLRIRSNYDLKYTVDEMRCAPRMI